MEARGSATGSQVAGVGGTGAPARVELAGIDTAALTDREREKWSQAVSELLAPCSDHPVSLARCVSEKRSCDACSPAAAFLVERVRRGEARSQLEAAFNARFSPEALKTVDPGDSPRLGAKDPVVQIVEWADFECPYCGLAAPILKEVVGRHADTVQLVFKHYPLAAHAHADAAARAAVAAAKQDKFWGMQQALFGAQKDGLDETRLRAIARAQQLDMKRFESDLASEAVADAVAADRKQADGLGLKGTPMIYINGRQFPLETFDLREDLDAWIELEVALRTGKGNRPSSTANAPVGKPAGG